jgi:ribonuclease HI
MKLPNLHPDSWASDLLNDRFCKERERAIFIIGMYSLWMQRNKRRHGEPQQPVHVAVRCSLDLAFDLWTAKGLLQPMRGKSQVQRWKAPPSGWYRCNTDGAFYSDQGTGASGVALRDDTGLFVGGQAKWYPNGLDALTLEVLACWDGVVYARDRGVHRLIVESDCQEYVKLWNERDHQRSRIAPIIRETRAISSSFIDFSVAFVSRSCHSVAHTLAKQVLGVNRSEEWQSAPACVEHLIVSDCNSP